MARPARVDMRCRNPWFLARLRVLGWKVRFTGNSWHGVGRYALYETRPLQGRSRSLISTTSDATLGRSRRSSYNSP